VAVQVVRKHRGQREIVAHIGSANTDAELGVLLERARTLAVARRQSRQRASSPRAADRSRAPIWPIERATVATNKQKAARVRFARAAKAGSGKIGRRAKSTARQKKKR
jgi:hypothetical protein